MPIGKLISQQKEFNKSMLVATFVLAFGLFLNFLYDLFKNVLAIVSKTDFNWVVIISLAIIIAFVTIIICICLVYLSRKMIGLVKI